MEALFGWGVTIGVAVLLQGAFATLISWQRRLASWWLPIQFFFPLALLFAHSMSVSPFVYFIIFLALLLVYWMPFKTRVPLYLSGESVWQKVAAFFPEDAPLRFVDVGSGLGGLALYLADRFPKASIVGIELAPIPWLISWLRARTSGRRVHFILGNYNKLDFSQFDIVFTFLSPAVMETVWEKVASDMKHDGLLLSYEFVIPNLKPDIVIEASGGDAALYGWRIAKAFTKQGSSS